MPEPTFLAITDLSVSYGKSQALSNVSLAVGDGEIVALLGANGAGKTTILRAVSGLSRPSSGRIQLDGVELIGRRPDQIVAAGVAHVPEGRQMFSELSVGDSLRLGGFLASRTERRARLDEVFALFPVLYARRKQRSGTLSGGEQQMVAIGRALMTAPSLLLLDEPSLGLAPIVVDQVFAAIVRIRNELNTSVLLVEQNAARALEVSDYAFFLTQGEIVGSGRATELDPARLRRLYFGGEAE